MLQSLLRNMCGFRLSSTVSMMRLAHLAPIHGNKSQGARQRALERFRAGEARVIAGVRSQSEAGRRLRVIRPLSPVDGSRAAK